MKIIAHRGYWHDMKEKNTAEAIRAALKYGYGFESDVRDYEGDLVISHDIPNANSIKAEQVFHWLREYEDQYVFAINIKSDGLKELLYDLLRYYQITNYFTFDMSVPQMVEYKEMGIRYFTRLSEVEPEPCLYDTAAGIWVDGFFSVDWINKELLKKHIDNNKEVIVVSPELHGRADYRLFWEHIKEFDLPNMGICTDRPDEAREFFYD